MCMITRILYTGCGHAKWVYELCPGAKKRDRECDLDSKNKNRQTASIPGREVDGTRPGVCKDEDCLVSFPVKEKSW